MALFRQVFKAPSLIRQCARLAATSNQQRGYADMSFTLACPSDVYYANAKVKQVDVPCTNQTLGVLPDHVPTIGVLQPGVVTVFEESGESKKFFVSSGSLTVNPDSSVQILAEEAHPLERFDKDEIRDGLNRAQQELASASSEVAQAEAQVAVETYQALQRFVE